jgi:hypothetical protein
VTNVSMMDLYGVKVLAHEWEGLKSLADRLFRFTMVNVPEKHARKQCVLIAIRARDQARGIR